MSTIEFVFDGYVEFEEWDEDGNPHLVRVPAPLSVDIPAEAYEKAPVDPDGYPRQEWGMFEGRPVVFDAATRPADAWEQAADYTQAKLDAAEVLVRQAELARVEALVVACDTSIKDLTVRYRRTDGEFQQRGLQAFAKQTALALGMSPTRVIQLLDTAHRAERLLPATWAVFRSLACNWRAVEVALDEAEGLPTDVWAAYDEAAARFVAATPASRLGSKLRKERERLQDDTAAARAKTTKEKRTARLRVGRDGGASFTFTGPAAELVAFDTALTKAAIAAKTDDEARTMTQLRYDIGIDLLVEGLKTAADPGNEAFAVPGRKGVDVVAAVTIPALAWLGVTKEQATLEGIGPIALETALTLAAEAKSLVRILTDPITGVRLALDRSVYRPPADLARWIAYRDQRCRFPGCNRRAVECDVDHIQEWQDHGVTDERNLVTVCRPTHIEKTLKLWREELDTHGTVDWESPWGRHFQDPPPDPADPAPRHLLPDECPF